MRAIIEDGYNRRVGIREVEGLIPGCEFSFRPLRGNERAELGKKLYQEDGDRTAVVFGLLEERVIDWNLRDGQGNTLKPQRVWFERLHPNLLQKMIDVIMGTDSPDYERGEHDEEQDQKN